VFEWSGMGLVTQQNGSETSSEVRHSVWMVWGGSWDPLGMMLDPPSSVLFCLDVLGLVWGFSRLDLGLSRIDMESPLE
jgi:hypothetical protein